MSGTISLLFKGGQLFGMSAVSHVHRFRVHSYVADLYYIVSDDDDFIT